MEQGCSFPFSSERTMKASKELQDCLQRQLEIELESSAIYSVHAAKFKRLGYGKLADHVHEEAVEEREHADKVMERMLFLGADPEVKSLKPAAKCGTVPEMLAAQLALEEMTQVHLAETITEAEAAEDYMTRELLEELLDPTEEAILWLNQQLELIEALGLQNYLQAQL